jgi:hypothetical protein
VERHLLGHKGTETITINVDHGDTPPSTPRRAMRWRQRSDEPPPLESTTVACKTCCMTTTRTIERPAWWWFVLLDGGLLTLGVLALSPRGAAWMRERAPLPSTRVLRSLLLAALVTHLTEGGVAWRRAKHDDLDASRWALQTAVVGFPSLRLLVAQRSS